MRYLEERAGGRERENITGIVCWIIHSIAFIVYKKYDSNKKMCENHWFRKIKSTKYNKIPCRILYPYVISKKQTATLA